MGFLYVYPNKLDLAVLAASSEDAALPIEHVQRQERGRIWASEDTSDVVITGNWDAPQALDTFVWYRHNLSAAATIRLRLYGGLSQTGTLLYDSGVVELGEDAGYGESDYGLFDYGGSSVFAAEGYAFYPLYFEDADVQIALSIQIDISDAANPDGHFETSRGIIGSKTELYYDAAKGSGWYWEEDTEQKRSAGGSLRSEEGSTPYRCFEIRMSLLNEADRENIFELSRDAGRRRDLFIASHPGEGGNKERDSSALVKITTLPKPMSRTDGHEQYESSIVFQES